MCRAPAPGLPTGVIVFRKLIADNPGLRELLAAQLVSEAGTWIAYVALTVDIYARTGSPAWVSAVLLAAFVPTVVLAPVVGTLVDRMSRRTLMVASDLCSALIFTALAFVADPVRDREPGHARGSCGLRLPARARFRAAESRP